MDLSAPRLGFTGGPNEFFSVPAGSQPPSSVILSEDEQGVFLEEKTDRLKWSLFDAPSTVQVVDLKGDEPQWHPLFAGTNHALAGEPVTKPPRSRMLVVLALVHYWECWQDAGDETDRPAPLLIENLDAQPISIAQFITEVHKYALGLRNLIYEIEDREESENALLYITGASGPKRKDATDLDALFALHAISNVVQEDGFFEDIWARKARCFALQHR